MPHFIRTLFAALILSACSPDDDGVLISNVSLIDVEQLQTRAGVDVRIQGERIVSIEPHQPGARAARMIDGEALFLAPGLYDAHVHIDTAERLALMLPDIFGAPVSAAEIDDDLAPYLAYGVNNIIDLGGNDDILAAKARAKSPSAFTPTIWSASPILDGPMTSNPAHLKIASVEEGEAAVARAAAAGHDIIKIYGQLDLDVRAAIIAKARALGLPVTGHLPQADSFSQTITPGLGNIAHAEEITRFWDGEDEAYLTGAIDLMVEHGVSLTPHLLGYREITEEIEDIEARLARLDWAMVPPLARVYATPPFNGYVADFAGDNSERYAAYFSRIAKAMDGLTLDAHRAGVKILAGTDAGNPTMFPGQGLFREIALLKAAGLTGHEALAAASLNIAAFLGVADDRGSVAVGKVADLVLFRSDPTGDATLSRDDVVAVVKAGHVFDREKIAAEIDRVSKAYDARERDYLGAALSDGN